MADKELDQQTRKLDQSRVDKGKEYEMMQKAQNQFLRIQAERKQNLNQQRTIMGMDQQQNMTLMQGAQIAATGGGNDPGIPQTVDPRTQAVMSKYGMGKPRFQKNTQHSQQVTKQNVTIHNTTNNNTTNNVAVPGGYGGPVQGRGLRVRGINNDSTEKFKVWLANSYARQQQQANIRNREYEKREDNLVRSSNKMMRKLEGIGKTMSKALNPRNIGNTLVDPLKMLFIFLGFHQFVHFWGKILRGVDRIQTWFENTGRRMGFIDASGHFKKPNINNGSKSLSFVGKEIVKAFGGDPRTETVGDCLHHLLIGDDSHYRFGLWTQIKQYLKDKFDERSKAIEQLPKPDLSGIKSGDFVGTLLKFGGYLSNIFRVALSGSRGYGQVVMEDFANSSKEFTSYSESAMRFKKKIERKSDAEIAQDFIMGNRSKSDKRKVFVDSKDIDFSKNNNLTKEDRINLQFLNNLKSLNSDQQKALLERMGMDSESGIQFFEDTVTSGSGLFKTTDIVNYAMISDKEGNYYVKKYDENGKSSSIYFETADQNMNSESIINENFINGSFSNSDDGRSDFSEIYISDDGLTLQDTSDNLAIYSQASSLGEMALTAKTDGNTGNVSKGDFALGLSRINSYLNSVDDSTYVKVPKITLTNLLGLSDEDIDDYIAKELIKNDCLYNAVTKLTFADRCVYAGAQSPEMAMLIGGMNAYLRKHNPLSTVFALQDYFPSTRTVIGLTMAKAGKWLPEGVETVANQTVKKGGKKAAKQQAVKFAKKEAAKLVLRQSAKFGAKILLRGVPVIGWVILAWDVFDIMLHRNEIFAGWEAGETAKEKIETNSPKTWGTICSWDEFWGMRQTDLEKPTEKMRTYNIHLRDKSSTDALANFEEVDFEYAKVKGAYLIKNSLYKSLLQSRTGITSSDKFNSLDFDGDNDLISKSDVFLEKTIAENSTYAYQDDENRLKLAFTGENTSLRQSENYNSLKRSENIQKDLDEWHAKASKPIEEVLPEGSSGGSINGTTAGSAATSSSSLPPSVSQSDFASHKKLIRDQSAGLSEKIKKLHEAFTKAGITDPKVQDAIIGNLITESSLNPEAEGTGGDEGIAQWCDLDRKKKVMKYINSLRKARGETELYIPNDKEETKKIPSISLTSFDDQVQALLYAPGEGLMVTDKNKALLEKMKKAGTLYEASQMFMDDFERPYASNDWYKKNPNEVYFDKETGQEFKSRNSLLRYRARKSAISSYIRDGKDIDFKNLYGYTEEELNKSNSVSGALGDVGNTVSETFESGKVWFEDKWVDAKEKAEILLERARKKTHELTSGPALYSFLGGDVGSECFNYDQYLSDNGSLPPGLNNAQWQEAVRRRTGYYPGALTSWSTGKLKVGREQFRLTPENEMANNKIHQLAQISRDLKAKEIEEQQKLAEEEEKRKKNEQERTTAAITTARNTAALARAEIVKVQLQDQQNEQDSRTPMPAQ